MNQTTLFEMILYGDAFSIVSFDVVVYLVVYGLTESVRCGQNQNGPSFTVPA